MKQFENGMNSLLARSLSLSLSPESLSMPIFIYVLWRDVGECVKIYYAMELAATRHATTSCK